MDGQGLVCSHNRVARLMQQHGLKAKQTGRFRVKTTDSAHDLPVAPNLLNQEFTAEQPDQKWTGDITYIPTAEGWLYLAVLIDLFSRRIVGWAMSDCLDRSLVIAALQMALETRQPPPGLSIFSELPPHKVIEMAENAITRTIRAANERSTFAVFDFFIVIRYHLFNIQFG